MSITSIMLILFQPLRTLGYDSALLIYLALSILAICAPFFFKQRHISWADQLIWLSLGGLLSLGSIAALDRGNNVVFVVPLLYVYLMSLSKKRWALVVVSIVLISSIKVWGIYFVVGLIAFRKYRYVLASLALSITANVVGIIVMHVQGFENSLSEKIRNTIAVTLDRGYSDFVSTYAISFSGLTKRVACIFLQDGACNVPLVSQTVVGSSYVKLLILLASFLVTCHLIRDSRVPQYVWFTSIAGLGIVAVPDAPLYNAVVVVSALGAILMTSSDEVRSTSIVDGMWQFLTAIPIVGSLLSATFVHHGSWETSTISGDELWWRSYYFTIPISWVIFYIGGPVILANHTRFSRKVVVSA